MRKEVKLDGAQLTNKVEGDKICRYFRINANRDEFLGKFLDLGNFSKGEDYIFYEDPAEGRNIKEIFVGYRPLVYLLRYLRGEQGNPGITMEIPPNPDMNRVNKLYDWLQEMKRREPRLKAEYIPDPSEKDELQDIKNRLVKELAQMIDREDNTYS